MKRPSGPRSSARFSRRQFLTLSGGALAVVAGAGAYDISSEVFAQQEDWRASAAPNDEFLRRHGRALRNVALGSSFAPEQWTPESRASGAPLAALHWAVSALGLRHLRLGLRWSAVEATPGVIDLTPYRPYLDYAFDSGLELCLNVGPIRTFRWPEEHLPSWLPAETDLPPTKAKLRPQSPLAERAFDYLARLFDALGSAYGRPLISSIPIIQLENEPFYPLGAHKWEFSREYLQTLVQQTDAVFPDSRLLFTSAARLNLAQVRDFFAGLLAGSSRFQRRLVMGFDYHYKTPLRDSIPLVRHLDPIAFARVGQESCSENRDMARAIGYRIEVSEAQAEPYAYLTAPGNSARHFRFVVLRCARRVLLQNEPSVIRIWGIEELAKKALSGSATREHHQIFDLVTRINSGLAHA